MEKCKLFAFPNTGILACAKHGWDRTPPPAKQLNSLVLVQRATEIRTLSLAAGTTIPVFGPGTWGLGQERAKRNTEIAALRLGDLGMTLIDTAENV